jgi:hypothetical protein
MNRQIMIALAIAAAGVLAASTVTVTMAAQGDSAAMTLGQSRKYMDYKDGVFKVKAGAG